MTPDTLVIDRTFKGVGRIKRATGSANPAMRRKLSRMLTTLHDEGRLDILRAIRDNAPGCSLLEVWDAFQRKTVDKLPVGTSAANLVAAFGKWVESLRVPEDYGADHVRTMGTTLNYFAAAKGGKKATVADLPAVLEELRTTIGEPHPRAFNMARSHAMAFVRRTLKKSHPLWLAVAAVEPHKLAKRVKGIAMPVHVFRNYFPRPGDDPVDTMAWSMATTGMHQKEYWGAWAVEADRVHIAGTKREGRVRDVPLVRVPTRPTMHRRTWENKVRERFDGTGHVPYDVRRTYSHWLELAGIPRTRRRMYIGHGAKDVLDLYEEAHVDEFLIDDAAALLKLIGLAAPTTPLRLAKAE